MITLQSRKEPTMTLLVLIARKDHYLFFADTRSADIPDQSIVGYHDQSQKLFFSNQHKITIGIAGDAIVKDPADPNNSEKILNVAAIMRHFIRHIETPATAGNVTCNNLPTIFNDFVQQEYSDYQVPLQGVEFLHGGFDAATNNTMISKWKLNTTPSTFTRNPNQVPIQSFYFLNGQYLQHFKQKLDDSLAAFNNILTPQVLTQLSPNPYIKAGQLDLHSSFYDLAIEQPIILFHDMINGQHARALGNIYNRIKFEKNGNLENTYYYLNIHSKEMLEMPSPPFKPLFDTSVTRAEYIMKLAIIPDDQIVYFTPSGQPSRLSPPPHYPSPIGGGGGSPNTQPPPAPANPPGGSGGGPTPPGGQ